MILFETIRWKNFLSTGDQWTEVKFDESPSTLIIGQNGAGKSTILDALCFALFNKPFRKINKPQLVNSINEKGLKVEVCFSIGPDDYRVFRGIKPNTFEIYKNNKLVDQDAAAKDTQKYLEQSVLKLNYKSFTQVVILGSSTFVPFMQLAAAHRREVIEDLLDIGIFSSMNSMLKDKIRAAQAQSKDCEHLLELSVEKVTSKKKLIDSLREVNTNYLKEKENKVSENLIKIDDTQIKLVEKQKQLGMVEFDLTAYNETKQNVSKFKQDRAVKKSDIKRLIGDVKFFESHSDCPTCGQSIQDNFKEKQIESLSDQGSVITKEVWNIEKEIDRLTAQLTEMDEKSSQAHEIRSEINILEREIVRLEFENLEIQKQLIDHHSNTTTISDAETSLSVATKELEKNRINCGDISRRLDEYNVASYLLKDSGIKSQIIKKYIPVFNQLINKYLQSMDFYVNFTLDEEFNEVIKSRFRDEFSYASFSEGEKQKIDLALLFTWREVARMKNSVATNLLILDEVFDSSLDTEGTNELLKILRSLGNETNVFVISHKGEILVDKFLRTLKFEKVNDFSKLSDDS
ncbi:recombination endonuclease [Synechococcus phage S-B64]|uniref:Recombination endonuclease n=2 Tax=Shandvirus TaxID=2948904 RepID=A0A1Z1LWJ6_9CAUD|nr:SbcC-like subunit of palindrome specific endonuclease [Synechococcus phage S-H35]YP_010095283.1 SbcC-like subunit of palindrome specific endonuclease [Synechococcus phage S-B64]ARW57037.1 recombination endonuclease [Synechococcus phage S-H35]AWD90081.1 recombination endonuclease [Synechococcus phage S-B64]